MLARRKLNAIESTISKASINKTLQMKTLQQLLMKKEPIVN